MFLENITDDIFFYTLGPFLNVYDIVHLMHLNKKIRKKCISLWGNNIKIYDTKTTIHNEKYIGEIFFRNSRKICRYCSQIFNSRNKLFQHLLRFNHYVDNYPELDEKKLSDMTDTSILENMKKINILQPFPLFPSFHAMEFFYMGIDIQKIKDKIKTIPNYHIMRIETLLGSVIISNLTYWYMSSHNENKFYYMWTGCWRNRKRIKLFILRDRYWLSIHNNLWIPIIDIQKIIP